MSKTDPTSPVTESSNSLIAIAGEKLAGVQTRILKGDFQLLKARNKLKGRQHRLRAGQSDLQRGRTDDRFELLRAQEAIQYELTLVRDALMEVLRRLEDATEDH